MIAVEEPVPERNGASSYTLNVPSHRLLLVTQ